MKTEGSGAWCCAQCHHPQLLRPHQLPRACTQPPPSTPINCLRPNGLEEPKVACSGLHQVSLNMLLHMLSMKFHTPWAESKLDGALRHVSWQQAPEPYHPPPVSMPANTHLIRPPSWLTLPWPTSCIKYEPSCDSLAQYLHSTHMGGVVTGHSE